MRESMANDAWAGQRAPARRPAPGGCGAGAIRMATLIAVACALASGCTAAKPPRAIDTAARAQQLIEAGNVAYRQGDYRLAVKRYSAAAVERQDDPAAYYGMGMALGKLGRDEDARKAYQRARDLTQSGAGAGGGGAPTPRHP